MSTIRNKAAARAEHDRAVAAAQAKYNRVMAAALLPLLKAL